MTHKRKVPKYLDDDWRTRIGAGKLLDHLRQNACGEREMTATQVRSAEILLKKVLPDLKGIEYKDENGDTVAPSVTIKFG